MERIGTAAAAAAAAADHLTTAPARRQWQALCSPAALDAPDLAADTRYASNAGRVEHRAELVADLARRFAQRPTETWLHRLAAAGVPHGLVNSMASLFAAPQVQHRGMVLETTHPAYGHVRLPGVPVKLSGTPAAADAPPPMLGEHTQQVLREVLGYDSARIEQLLAPGGACCPRR